MTNPSNHSEKAKPGFIHRSLFFRFHLPHVHLNSVFGDDWFALKAEAFARFFGTPVFLIGQTIVVALWIVANMVGFTEFDLYPFILLNLAFSLQAAYAAPFIMMSQNRQQDIDRQQAANDYRINIKAELEIELLHEKVDELRQKEVLALTETVQRLCALLEKSEDSPKR
jgi:uncharacterized membrane protein